MGVAAVAALVAGLCYVRANFSPAARLAKLPVAEQNRIIFDAAIELLKSNYYDPALFQNPEWAGFEQRWRKQCVDYPGRGVWLYMNVLQNFSTSFPESHLNFESPKNGAVPPPGFDEPMPAAPKAESPAVVSKPVKPALDLTDAGTGFEYATIRRGNYQRTVVTEVLRGSPAEQAGVLPGWALGEWHINGDAGGMHYKATFFMLPTANARELERSGLPLVTTSQQEVDDFLKPRTTELAFDYGRIPPRPNFETHALANGATYLRFDTFDDWSVASRVIDVIDAAGPKGLVLDLRHNLGGLMLHMMRINGRLLGGDVELGTLHGRDGTEPMNSMKLDAGHYEGPLVVLIGPTTASAAEITAAALQYYRRGMLIGRTTNGSVVSSQKYSLPDGGLMTIPTKDFMRPDKRRIEGVGVEPDVWIMPTPDDVRAGRDPTLEKAVELLAAGPNRAADQAGGNMAHDSVACERPTANASLQPSPALTSDGLCTRRRGGADDRRLRASAGGRSGS